MNRRKFLEAVAAASTAPVLASLARAPVVSSDRGGLLPVTVFGVNAYDLLFADLKGEERLSTAKLQRLGQSGIPFVRFAASGQWAGDWQSYLDDKDRHWRCLKNVFEAAEGSGVQLIPTVHWHPSALAFQRGEPVSAWADPASRTRKTADEYTHEFVQRFDGSSSLLMYEFTNELNDWVDVPDVLRFWPRPDPTRPLRLPTDQDKITSRQMREFTDDFAEIIRSTSDRPISLGINSPRTNAWHLARGLQGTDEPWQFVANLQDLHGPLVDVMSMHIYPGNGARWGKQHSTFATLDEMLSAFVSSSRPGRTTLLGEFGVPSRGDPAGERSTFFNMVSDITKSGVRYAAIWNFSKGLFGSEWDVDFEGDRSYQIEEIINANKI